METTERVKLTKSALNKFIVWSSTRYNDWLGYGTKSQNVQIVFDALISGSHKGESTFAIKCAQPTGENYYAKSSRYWKTKQGGSTYIIDCKDKTVTEKVTGRTIAFFNSPPLNSKQI